MTVPSTPQSSDLPSHSHTHIDRITAMRDSSTDVADIDRMVGRAEIDVGIENVLRSSQNLPVALLSNISAVALEQNDHEPAFFYAGVVSAFPHTPLSAKAYYRAAVAARDWPQTVWPVLLIHAHNCMGDLSLASQQFIIEKTAELDKFAVAAGSIGEMVAKGIHHTSAANIQARFCHRVSQTAVHILRSQLHNHDIEVSGTAVTFGGSLAHALELKEAGNEAFCRKSYVVAILKYREAISTFHTLPVLLIQYRTFCKNLKLAGCLAGTLMPLAALAIHPQGELGLVAAAEGADSLLYPTLSRT